MVIAEKLICSLGLAASLLLAQTPGALVRLHVAALESSGEPVRNLKVDDFKLFDQNKPQRVVFFRGNDAQPATALGPHEYSNRTAGASPHSTVILFDLLNENQSDRLDVWHKLGRSLQQLESGDSLYLYLLSLEGALLLIHPIGGKAGDDRTWTQQVEKALDKAMKGSSHARPVGMSDEDAVKKTYVALETLGNQLAAMSGHGDIVWITNGVPNVWNPKTPCNGDWVDCALYVPHLSVTLERDNVAVNPLSYSSSPSPDMTRDMEQMAGLSGGWTYMGEDIRTVLKQVNRDAVAGYTLAYEPAADEWDSKFHKIRVTCENKGIKLHTKQRRYAYPDQRPAAAKQQAALLAAYQATSDNPEIGLRATVSADAGKAVHLQIKVNPADLLWNEESDHFNGGLTLLLADFGATGPIGEPVVSSFNLRLTREQRSAVTKDGIPVVRDHPINDSIQKVRIIMLDPATNAAGSLTVPVGP